MRWLVAMSWLLVTACASSSTTTAPDIISLDANAKELKHQQVAHWQVNGQVQTSKLKLAAPTEKLSFIDADVATRVTPQLQAKITDHSFDNQDLQQISTQVLQANAKRLGIESVLLTHVKSEFANFVARSRYQQVLRLSDGSLKPVINAGIEVLYNYKDFTGLYLTQIKQIVYPNLAVQAKALNRAALAAKTQQTFTAVEQNGAIVSFTPTRIESKGTGVLVKDGVVTLVEQQLVEGTYPSGKSGNYLAMVDAQGDLVDSTTTEVHVGFKTEGLAEVYDPNPIENPLKVESRIFNLPGNLHLYGKYADVHTSSVVGDVVGTLVGDIEEYRFFNAPPPLNRHTAETSVYNNINKRKGYINTLGYNALMNFNIYIDAIDPNVSVSSYNLQSRSIGLDPSLFDAYDSDINIHEYGHAVHHDIGGLGILGYPFNIPNPMDEGSADYYAVSNNNDIEFAEQSGQFETDGYLRKVNVSTNFIDNITVNPNTNGLMWATAFYSLRKIIGKQKVDQLVHQLVYHILPTDNFNTALETAVIPAAQDLDPTNARLIEQIRNVMSLHKIYGNQAPRVWSTPYLMSDTRPYANNHNNTKTYSIAGATSLIVQFDEYTKVNENDQIVITDGSDTPISGSPFIGDSLRGAKVQVPGDTIKITLNSNPSDNLGGYGYLITKIAASNPGNQLPLVNPTLNIARYQDPATAVFDLSASTDSDGNLVTYTIDPGDGSELLVLDPLQPRAVHIYNRSGILPITQTTTFTATFSVIDNQGGVSSTSRNLTIHPYRPDRKLIKRCIVTGSTLPGRC